MTPGQLLAYLGPALLAAGAGTVLILTLLRLASARPDARQALTLCLALFFLILTQHPLPDRAALDCSQGGVMAILQPFATLDHLARLWRDDLQNPDPVGLWLGSKVVQAAVMNVLLCAAIGAALARHLRGPRAAPKALAIGAALSGGAELAQLTGLFGLYPCAWRTFEVDDLILNIGGLMAGFALMRHWQR